MSALFWTRSRVAKVSRRERIAVAVIPAREARRALAGQASAASTQMVRQQANVTRRTLPAPR